MSQRGYGQMAGRRRGLVLVGLVLVLGPSARRSVSPLFSLAPGSAAARRTPLRPLAAVDLEVPAAQADVDESRAGGVPAPAKTIYVCTGSSCTADGSAECLRMLRELSPEGVVIKETVCLGPCGSGPNVLATPPPEQPAVGGRVTEAKVAAGPNGSVEQPAGVCFTGLKTEADAALLEPWGFEGSQASQGPLGALRLLVRSSQLDQVPWPILLYVGVNGLRVISNALFHVDPFRVIGDLLTTHPQ